MAAPDLTATTTRYLFARSWAKPGSGWSMTVPGGDVDGPQTAANLFTIAVWSLREQGLVEVEQIRPYEDEKTIVLGGTSFSRVTAVDPTAELPGLEGALLDAWRENREPKGRLAKFFDRDEPDGLRSLIYTVDLGHRAPWAGVAAHCQQEARDAGLLEIKGRVFKKLAVPDPAALEALKPHDDEIAAARQTHMDREPELDQAVFGDCVQAIEWLDSDSTD